MKDLHPPGQVARELRRGSGCASSDTPDRIGKSVRREGGPGDLPRLVRQPFTAKVTRGGPGATITLEVSGLTFHEILVEGHIDVH